MPRRLPNAAFMFPYPPRSCARRVRGTIHRLKADGTCSALHANRLLYENALPWPCLTPDCCLSTDASSGALILILNERTDSQLWVHCRRNGPATPGSQKWQSSQAQRHSLVLYRNGKNHQCASPALRRRLSGFGRIRSEAAAQAAPDYFTRTSLRSASRWDTRRMNPRICGYTVSRNLRPLKMP